MEKQKIHTQEQAVQKLLINVEKSIRDQKKSPNYKLISGRIIPWLKQEIQDAKEIGLSVESIRKMETFLKEYEDIIRIGQEQKNKLREEIERQRQAEEKARQAAELERQRQAEEKARQAVELERVRNKKIEKNTNISTTKYLVDKEGNSLDVPVYNTHALTSEDAEEKGFSRIGKDFELNKKGFISILFLGKDSSNGRSDTIIQFLIDPYSGDMAQVSISRDVLVKNKRDKLVKLNSLREEELLSAITDITGQESLYLTTLNINNFSSFFQPLIDKYFPTGVQVDFGDRVYEIGKKKYKGIMNFSDAQELLTLARARKGITKNGRLHASDTERRERQEFLIQSILLKNPWGVIQAGSSLGFTDILTHINGNPVGKLDTGAFIKELFLDRTQRRADGFSTQIQSEERIPYGKNGKTHLVAKIKVEDLRKQLHQFFNS